MLHIVLVEPEIPQNCGNISRTCAVIGASLHLVRPLGFDISQDAVRRNMKRCGLDYWHLVEVTDYENLEDLFRRHPEAAQDLWLATTKAPGLMWRQRSRRTAGSSLARRPPDCPRHFGNVFGIAASVCP